MRLDARSLRTEYTSTCAFLRALNTLSRAHRQNERALKGPRSARLYQGCSILEHQTLPRRSHALEPTPTDLHETPWKAVAEGVDACGGPETIASRKMSKGTNAGRSALGNWHSLWRVTVVEGARYRLFKSTAVCSRQVRRANRLLSQRVRRVLKQYLAGRRAGFVYGFKKIAAPPRIRRSPSDG